MFFNNNLHTMVKLTTSDEVLVASYRNGNTEAFTALVTRHTPTVVRAMWKKTKDTSTAEDLAQETFLKVFNALQKGNYNEQNKFVPWLMRIANNLFVDRFRKSKREPKVVTTSTRIFNMKKFAESHEDWEELLDKNAFQEKLWKLVDQLPSEQREVVILRMIHDYEFPEIAEKTKVSVNTSLGRMRYALMNIRRLLGISPDPKLYRKKRKKKRQKKSRAQMTMTV